MKKQIILLLSLCIGNLMADQQICGSTTLLESAKSFINTKKLLSELIATAPFYSAKAHFKNTYLQFRRALLTRTPEFIQPTLDLEKLIATIKQNTGQAAAEKIRTWESKKIEFVPETKGITDAVLDTLIDAAQKYQENYAAFTQTTGYAYYRDAKEIFKQQTVTFRKEQSDLAFEQFKKSLLNLDEIILQKIIKWTAKSYSLSSL